MLTTRIILRLFDLLLASVGLILMSPLLLVLYLIALIDTGKPLLLQVRVGRHQQPFVLVKFRTMRLETAHVASHLISRQAITPFGGVLRRTKLDELPQLWNVLKGEMSLVGPRPCLLNQLELIGERESLNVFNVRPGITGLAQIKNIDMSTPRLLAETDFNMLQGLTISSYLKYLYMTLLGRGGGDCVKD